MKVNIGLLEDDLIEKQALVTLLERFFNEKNIETSILTFDNSEDFLKLDFDSLDLLILDIILENETINGVDVAKIVRERKSKVNIIFLTKTAQFAINGYEVNALDYALKPVSYEDIKLKLNKFINIINNRVNKDLVFKCKDRTLKIKEDDIYYIDIYKHYLNIHSSMGDYECRGTMKETEKILSNRFVRVSNNCIVNMAHIEQIVKNDVIIKGQSIRITGNYKDTFLQLFNEYVNKYA